MKRENDDASADLTSIEQAWEEQWREENIVRLAASWEVASMVGKDFAEELAESFGDNSVDCMF